MYRRNSFKFIISIVLLSVFVLFQNCSKVLFTPSKKDESSKSQNNGGGYGGKPKGEFYRFNPEFKCENKESFSAKIEITDTVINLTENKQLLCNATRTSLNPALVDSSIYQEEIVGYKEGIFEGAATEPTKIPANLVEVWCRDKNDQTGIETITHYDRNTKLAVNRIYHAVQDANGVYQNRMIPDFTVGRTIAPATVTVSDGKDFELTVNRDQPAAQEGLFNGHLRAVIEGKSVDRAVTCRLGGSLDAQVWPVRQVVDMNVLYTKTSADRNFIGYTSTTGVPVAGRAYLYTLQLGQSLPSLVSQGLSIANDDYEFSADSKKLLYLNDDINAGSANLELFDLVARTSRVISSTTSTASVYSLSADSQFVFYNSGTKIGAWIKSASVNGGSEKELQPPLTPEMGSFDNRNPQTHYSTSYAVSPVGSKVAFICCNSKIDLYISNADGSGLRDVTPPLPTGYMLYGVKFAEQKSDKILVGYAWTDPMKMPVKYLNVVVNVDTMKSFVLPADMAWVSSNQDGTVGLIANLKTFTLRNLVDLQTGTVYSLPAIGTGDFTKDSRWYAGLVGSGNSSKAIAVSVIDGTTKELCSGVAVQSLQEIAPGVFAMVSDDGSGVMNIHLTSSVTSECRKVNSVAVARGTLKSLSAKVTPDLRKLVVQRRVQLADSTTEDMLYYVPLDGKPALKINTPVFRGADVNSYEVLNDSKSVIYTGQQIQLGLHNVFRWSAP